jgi:hypothetical protein
LASLEYGNNPSILPKWRSMFDSLNPGIQQER